MKDATQYQNLTYLQIFDSGYKSGADATLLNETLMAKVTNDFNLIYLDKYEAIPIFYNGRMYQCSNVVEVKLR